MRFFRSNRYLGLIGLALVASCAGDAPTDPGFTIDEPVSKEGVSFYLGIPDALHAGVPELLPMTIINRTEATWADVRVLWCLAEHEDGTYCTPENTVVVAAIAPGDTLHSGLEITAPAELEGRQVQLRVCPRGMGVDEVDRPCPDGAVLLDVLPE